eukprot:4153752-Alexandrium_andersonii.AAC.1
MSASLVGSEMCIRDRSDGGAVHAQGRRKARRRLGGPARGEALQLRHPPVSYTHLTLPTICSV